MNIKDDNPQSAFSLIADFEGDMEALMHTPHDSVLPALPLRNMMLFPGVVGSISVGRESSMKVVSSALKNGSLIAVFTQKDASVDEPEGKDLYPIGVLARVMRTIDIPDGTTAAIVQSYGPLKLESVKRRRPYLRVEVSSLEETLYADDDKEFSVLVESCRDAVVRFLKLSEGMRVEEAAFAVRNISHPVFLINFICVNMAF